MKSLLILFIICVSCSFVYAQTWTGTTNTSWDTPSNWSSGTIPNAASNITIPASLTNYPVLQTDVTINGIVMAAGSSLDFNGKKLTVSTNSGFYNNISGATLNNSLTRTDIVLEINTGTGGYTTTFNSNTINDNITLNLSNSNSFDEGTSSPKSIYNGNTIFNIAGSMNFIYSQSVKSENNGNLTFNRSVAGNTTLFNSGGIVTGNFSYNNPTSGTSVLGNTVNRTAIGGKVDINVNNTSTSGFGLYRLVNQTTGGIITVVNTLGFDVLNDTLKVNSLSISGYRGGGYGRLTNNKIIGNLSISDDASYGSGYDTRISHNEIIGTSIFSNNGTNTFFEANETSSQNIFSGSVTYSSTNTGILNIGNQEKSTYSGNVTISRTAAGSSLIFGKGALIVGNFSFTNSTSGTSSIGNINNKISIGGTVNIAINNTTTSGFGLYWLVNQTPGGTISVQNSTGFEVINDTLLVNSLSVLGYAGGNYGRLINNKISGNLTIADDPTYSGGYDTKVLHNDIGGNASFTNNSTNTFFEASETNGNNIFSGNVIYTATNTGTLSIGSQSKSAYGGNVSISRTASGSTSVFGKGASIIGNFAYTNLFGGDSFIGQINNKTTIGGTINVNINNIATSGFGLYWFVNQVSGGLINVQNTIGFEVISDTMLVNSLSITGYRGGNYARFLNNRISGNLTISDDASYSGGYDTKISHNEIGGISTFTNNGTNVFFEASETNTQNVFSGNVSYSATNVGALNIGNQEKSTYGGNVSISRTAAGTTSVFGKGAKIAGDFSFSNLAGGSSGLGNVGHKTSIGGQVNINIVNISTSPFNLYRFVNLTNGGTISISNSQVFDITNDTLLVSSFSVIDYTGGGFAQFFENKISGDLTLTSDASFGGGYSSSVFHNEIGGNSIFTNKSPNQFFDATNSNTSNKYLGNVTYNKIGGNFTIATNSENEYGKGITFNSSGGITINNVKFISAADGIFEQLGSQAIIIPNIKLEKIGLGKLTLNSQLTVGNSITFTSGYISASLTKELVFPDNIGYTGASDASYVIGNVIKRGDDPFVFPVGGGGKLAKIGISAPSSNLDEFTGVYFASAPSNPTQKEVSIDHISLDETWVLVRSVGTGNVFVTLSWETARSGIVDTPADLRVAVYEMSVWTNKGNGGTTGTNLSGEIVSAAALGNSGLYTLASVNATNIFLPIFETINTGIWNIGSTWIAPSNPVVPYASKIAKINSSHIVTIPNTGNQIKTIQMNGGVINLNGGTLEIKNQ